MLPFHASFLRSEKELKEVKRQLTQIQDKGVGALQKAVAAMKIPSALSRLKAAFRGGKESMNDRADKMAVISSELHVIGSHTKNVDRILMGKAAKEVEPQNMDKGITARIEKAYLACGRGLDPMQSSEGGFNTRYPREPNGITDPEYSIQCGVQELKSCLVSAGVENPIVLWMNYAISSRP